MIGPWDDSRGRANLPSTKLPLADGSSHGEEAAAVGSPSSCIVAVLYASPYPVAHPLSSAPNKRFWARSIWAEPVLSMLPRTRDGGRGQLRGTAILVVLTRPKPRDNGTVPGARGPGILPCRLRRG